MTKARPTELKIDKNTKQLILSGKAIFTIHNTKTNNHHTYKIVRTKKLGKFYNQPYWKVFTLVSPDKYKYIGYIKPDKSLHLLNSTMYQVKKIAIKFFYNNLGVRLFPSNFKFYHQGYCMRCGRTLTHPESILSGIGPICAEKVGF